MENMNTGDPNGKHRFNTYDNMYGTIDELMVYFKKHIIRDRQLAHNRGEDYLNVLRQLTEIRESKDKQGIVVFMFHTNDYKTMTIEKVWVLVRDKARNKVKSNSNDSDDSDEQDGRQERDLLNSGWLGAVV